VAVVNFNTADHILAPRSQRLGSWRLLTRAEEAVDMARFERLEANRFQSMRSGRTVAEANCSGAWALTFAAVARSCAASAQVYASLTMNRDDAPAGDDDLV
jgi:hypothetical protein